MKQARCPYCLKTVEVIQASGGRYLAAWHMAWRPTLMTRDICQGSGEVVWAYGESSSVDGHGD